MPMQRYAKTSEIRMKPGTGAVSAQAEANTWQTLSEELDKWSGVVEEHAMDKLAVEGRKQAEKAFLNEGTNAKLNHEYTYNGETYNKSLEAMQTKQIAIDNDVKMQDLYTKFEDDPEGFENAIEGHRRGMMSQLPEHLKVDFTIDFEANKAHHVANVITNRKKLNDEKMLAAANNFHRTIVSKSTQASRDGSVQRAAYETRKGVENLQEAKDNKIITAVQYEKSVAELLKGVEDARHKGINDRNIEDGDLTKAQGYVDKFRGEKNKLYSDDERESLADEMQKDINAEIKLRKANKEVNREENTITIDDAIKVIKSGKFPNNMGEIALAMPGVKKKKSHEYKIQYKALQYSTKVLDGKSIPQQQNFVNAALSDGTASREEVEVLNIVQSNLKERAALAKKDPMSLGVQEGLYVQMSTITPKRGTPGLVDLKERSKQQVKNIQEYGKAATALFTEQEAEAWSAYLNDDETPVSDKIEFIQEVHKMVPKKAYAVLAQLRNKDAGLYSFAGDLALQGKKDIAGKVLKGQALLKTMGDQDYIKEFRRTIQADVGNAFIAGSGRDMDALVDTALAYSVYQAMDRGDITDLKGSTERSVFKDITNGISSRNGQDFFLPKGTNEDQFEEWIDETLKEKDFANVSGKSPKEALEYVRGSKVRIVSVGEGRYAFYDENAKFILRNKPKPGDKLGSAIILEKK